MSFIERLTPKDTEEIKPGIFIQKRGEGYRVVNPITWDNEWRLNKHFGWRNLFTIVLILFLAWSYFTETQFCRELQENPCEILPNITNYCMQQQTNNQVIYEEGENLYTIQDYP